MREVQLGITESSQELCFSVILCGIFKYKQLSIGPICTLDYTKKLWRRFYATSTLQEFIFMTLVPYLWLGNNTYSYLNNPSLDRTQWFHSQSVQGWMVYTRNWMSWILAQIHWFETLVLNLMVSKRYKNQKIVHKCVASLVLPPTNTFHHNVHTFLILSPA